MKKYNVYYQSVAGLKLVGQTEGRNGSAAIETARKQFKITFPVVHELTHEGNERWY